MGIGILKFAGSCIHNLIRYVQHRMRNSQRSESSPDLVDRPATPASTVVTILNESFINPFGGGTDHLHSPDHQEEYELDQHNHTPYSPMYPQIDNTDSTSGYDNDETYISNVPN